MIGEVLSEERKGELAFRIIRRGSVEDQCKR